MAPPRRAPNRLVALLAAAVALGVVPFTAAGVPVLVAGGVALLVGVLRTRPPGGGVVTLWVAVIGAGVGCYLLKLAGLSVPPRVLEHRVVARVADLLPVALLAALVAVQVFADSEQRLVLDARAAALGAAVVMLLLRAPFLVVVFGSALVAALLRMV